jgi:hypothetical protein
MSDIPISADSHVVEAREVFDGLADRFGDEAPRIMTTKTAVDAMVIPAKRRASGGAAAIGIAGARLRHGASVVRREGHKPAVDDFSDPELQAILKQGYPAAGLAELERAIAAGFVGGCIPCEAPTECRYRDPVYEPIWAAAAEARFPLSLHVGTNAYTPREHRTPKARRDPIDDYTGRASSTRPSRTTAPACSPAS